MTTTSQQQRQRHSERLHRRDDRIQNEFAAALDNGVDEDNTPAGGDEDNTMSDAAEATATADNNSTSDNNTANNNNNNILPEEEGADEDTPQPTLTIERIRAKFRDKKAILKASRGKSTFCNHQRENTKLLFYLYKRKRALLHDDFYQELEQIDEAIDYRRVRNPRRQYKGPLSLEERIDKHRDKVMRDHIGNVLGEPGTRATKNTVKLDEFTSTPEHFVDFLQTRVKNTGQLMKPGVYSGYASNLTFLFKRHRFTPRASYTTELRDYMDGVKRLANEGRAQGEVRSVV